MAKDHTVREAFIEMERLKLTLGGKGNVNSKWEDQHRHRCGGENDHGSLEGQGDHLTEGVGHKRQGCLGRYTSSKRTIDMPRGGKTTSYDSATQR